MGKSFEKSRETFTVSLRESSLQGKIDEIVGWCHSFLKEVKCVFENCTVVMEE